MRFFIKIFIILLITLIGSFYIYSQTVIEIEKTDLEQDLMAKIKHNEKIYSSSVSALLYEFNEDILTPLLNSIYSDKEIIKVELDDFSNNIDILLNEKPFVEKDILISKINLVYNNENIGTLTITYTKEHISNLLDTYRKNIFAFSLILLFVLITVHYFISRKLTSSLEYLSDATDTISSGDLSKKIDVVSNDEIGLLANKFEHMRVSLNTREKLNERQSKKIKALNEEMIGTQIKLIEILGEVIEKRYIDDPNHIKRVAEMSYTFAILSGLKEEDAKTLQMVSPMHDVGKIGIPDSILLKPGKLTPEEFEVMKEHSKIGYDFLKGTGKKTLNMAANVAYEHHEKWDGNGYPRGLKGEDITLEGRITALADVFDALANKRCYKDAWKTDEIISYLKEQRKKQFDPNLVDIFLDNIQVFLEIQKKHQS